MAGKSVSGTPEEIAYLLFEEIRSQSRGEPRQKNAILALYRECLAAVRGTTEEAAPPRADSEQIRVVSEAPARPLDANALTAQKPVVSSAKLVRKRIAK